MRQWEYADDAAAIARSGRTRSRTLSERGVEGTRLGIDRLPPARSRHSSGEDLEIVDTERLTLDARAVKTPRNSSSFG